MRSIEHRFKLIEKFEPHWTPFTCFSQAVSGQNFTRRRIYTWFDCLVPKEDYNILDKNKLVGHLHSISMEGKPYQTHVPSMMVRRLREYEPWKSSILERDKCCVWCSSLKNLEVDHIKPLNDIVLEFGVTNESEARECSELWDVNNGRVLCKECHIVRHSTSSHRANLPRRGV